jgi:hypothetical protein
MGVRGWCSVGVLEGAIAILVDGAALLEDWMQILETGVWGESVMIQGYRGGNPVSDLKL